MRSPGRGVSSASTRKGLKYRYYYNNWDLGHRYILNLRDGEVYTRYYHRLDADSPKRAPSRTRSATSTRPIRRTSCPTRRARTPRRVNPRYHIRGNGAARLGRRR